MKKGLFISVEGGEGVGKSTAMKAITDYLQSAEIDFVLTREPGGTEIAEAIRQVLLQNYTESMHVDTELLLMFACRAQNVAKVILPALQAGQWVVTDRFADASFAYQGGGRGIAMQRIAQLSQWVLGDLQPDITILLDAPVAVGLARIKDRGAQDRIESEGIEFLNRVRNTYLDLAKRFPHRYHVVQADQSLANVHQQIIEVIKPFVNKK